MNGGYYTRSGGGDVDCRLCVLRTGGVLLCLTLLSTSLVRRT